MVGDNGFETTTKPGFPLFHTDVSPCQRLRQLFEAGVPVIAVGETRFRVEGGLPPGWVWDDDEE